MILPFEMTKGKPQKTSYVSIVSCSANTSIIVIKPSHVSLLPSDLKVIKLLESDVR